MSSVLVVFASGHGQTALVAQRIAAALVKAGHAAFLADVADPVAPPVWDHDAVLVGAPVRFGKHHPDIIRFCREQAAALRVRPHAFFSVSMSAAGDKPGSRREVAKAVAHFIKHTAWVPARVEAIGGALKYTQYGPLLRAVMRMIASMAGHSTDTSRDHEYTDWQQVERFALQFAAQLSAQATGAASPGAEARAASSSRAPPASIRAAATAKPRSSGLDGGPTRSA
jgi:menaquinone-dependent protoporphyrinogen oxidase